MGATAASVVAPRRFAIIKDAHGRHKAGHIRL
jgi:hypothetical protein